MRFSHTVRYARGSVQHVGQSKVRMPFQLVPIFCLVVLITTSVAADTAPFSMELEEMHLDQPVALHSYCVGTFDGKWLLLGGRTNGLHGFASKPTDPPSFPIQYANKNAYVIEPLVGKVLGLLDLTILGSDLFDQLISTNIPFTQVGNLLYLVGGYGMNSRTKEMITFDTITTIKVDELIQMIIKGEKDPNVLKPLFKRSQPDRRFKVTGGVLRQLNNQFYLVFGHSFDGGYTIRLEDYNKQSGMKQVYTQKIRVFTLDKNLNIATYNEYDAGYDPSLPYNRRDLNVVDMIRGDGKTQALTVYGGVFKAGQLAGHLNPINIDPQLGQISPVKVTLVKTFEQGLNHYKCATVSIFDPATATMYTIFFGGISQFHYDATTDKLIRDAIDLSKGVDGLPFIDTITAIAQKDGTPIAQYILPKPMPWNQLLGTEADFIPDEKVPRFPNDVINLRLLHGRALAGYIYGGIVSQKPYSGGQTAASSRIFQVWITPDETKVIPVPPIPTTVTPVSK